MKYLFDERSDKGHPEEPPLCSTQAHGVIPQALYENRVVVTSQKGLEQQKLVKKGDFVISLRAFQGGIEIAHYQGIISAAYTILKLRDADFAPYFRWLFKAHNFIQLLRICVTGIREGQNINYSLLSRKYLPLPPPAEQRAIVAYLDAKCGKIDALVAAKTKMAALLKELRQRLIADAVTGRAPRETRDSRESRDSSDSRFSRTSRTSRDSRLEFLGEIPAGWEITTLRRLLKLVSRKGFTDLPLLSVTREQGVIKRDIESKEANHNFIPDDLSNYKLVEEGDFAINKMKSWQGSYGVSDFKGIVSPAYYVCKLTGVDKKFFSVAIRSRAYVSFFARYSKGIRVDQWDLSTIALKEIPFALPPLATQRAIVAYLDAKCSKIDSAIRGTEKEIELLKEYRQRLIADVVTGKKKVS